MYPGGTPNLPAFFEAEPTFLPKSEIYDLAEEMTHTLGYRPAGELEPLVRRLGGIIRDRPGQSSADTGSIVVHGPNDFTIFLSPYIGERRRRFTVVHELGHYILHSEFGKRRIIVKREGSNRVEWEANWFASGFLMPGAIFRGKQQAGWDTGRLADFFNVSEAAVEIRGNRLRVKTKLTPEELKDLLRPRLMLFMSVDLEGSTAFKQRAKLNAYDKWLDPFFVFLKEFGSDMDAERRKVAEDMPAQKVPVVPHPWKILGDELIYVVELTSKGEADFHVRAFLQAIQYRNAQERFALKVKGSAWLAGFPVGNALLPLENDGAHDYLGASIDIGFRLSKFSTVRRMCISVDLAWLLLDSKVQDFDYGYEGRKELKGVMEKTGYPIIWIDAGSSKSQKSEEQLLKKEECDAKLLKAFCKEFILETGSPRFLPFIHDSKRPDQAPPEYPKGVADTEDFLRQVFDVSDDQQDDDDRTRPSRKLKRVLLKKAKAAGAKRSKR